MRKIEEEEKAALALMDTQKAAYEHGIDPNAWRAEKTKAIAHAVSDGLSSVAGAFTGKGGSKKSWDETPHTQPGVSPIMTFVKSPVGMVLIVVLVYFGLIKK